MKHVCRTCHSTTDDLWIDPRNGLVYCLDCFPLDGLTLLQESQITRERSRLTRERVEEARRQRRAG